MLQRLPGLIATDLRLMLRDGFLFSIGLLYLAFAVVLRIALPELNQLSQSAFGFDLAAAYPALVAFVVFFEGAVPAGVITAFLLIEERDQRTIDALLVSPLPISAFLSYRLLSAYLLSLLTMIAAFLIIGVQSLPLRQLLVVSATAAGSGPLIALTIAAGASNKIEGFAVLKSVNLIGLPILIAWFSPAQWHWLLWPFPSYWSAGAAWAETPAAALTGAAAAGLLTVAALVLLSRRYDRKLTES